MSTLVRTRLQYIILLTIFFICVLTFYFTNPFGLATTYFGQITPVIIFVGVFFLGLIINYTIAFSSQEQDIVIKSSIAYYFANSVIILLSLGVSGGLIYWLVMTAGNLSSTSSIVSFVINICILTVVFGLLFKILMSSKFIKSAPVVRFIINVVLYIPCILVIIIEYLVWAFSSAGERGASIKNKMPVPSIGTKWSFPSIGQNWTFPEIGNRVEFILLGLTIVLVALAIIVPRIENKFILQGGKQLINNPIYTSVQTNLASYIQLNDLNPVSPTIIYDYNYAISLWLYLDSVPTSEDKHFILLNYGNKPLISYKSSTNTLVISQQYINDSNISSTTTTTPTTTTTTTTASTTASTTTPTATTTTSTATTMTPTTTTTTTTETVPVISTPGEHDDYYGNRVIYRNTNVQLQKWNNIIMNYSGGTLDIFYNGELVKSQQNVMTYMMMDTLSVGEFNGMNGGICNLIYFKDTLNANQIYYLYNSVKDKTPPALSSSTETVVTNAVQYAGTNTTQTATSVASQVNTTPSYIVINPI